MRKPFAKSQTEIIDHIDPSKPVRVYRNLHKQCYSIQQGGIVKCHADKVELYNCTFKVLERGRQRVLREQRKNVHSFVVGKVSSTYSAKPCRTMLFYDPYKSGDWLALTWFSTKLMPVSGAFIVRLDHRGCTAVDIETKKEAA